MDEIDANGGEPLEKRYIHTKVVGGAYNCKNILKPKSIDQSLKDATFGKKVEESLMIEGLDLERYIKHDKIIPSKNKSSSILMPLKIFSSVSGTPNIPIPPVFIPTYPSFPIPISPQPPIIPAIVIYWDNDSDVWDSNKLIGQTYWDS